MKHSAKGPWRWVGWAALVVVIIILVVASRPDRGMQVGEQGSYLGRSVSDAQVGANRVQDLQQRTATMRY